MPHQEKITASPSSFERTVPNFHEKDFTKDEILPTKREQQWGMTTEMLRRGVLRSQEVRQALTHYAGVAVSEDLPHQAVSSVTEADYRTARVMDRMTLPLGRALETESTPDELLTPDLANAVADEKIPPYKAVFIADRYRYARDVKLLALMAELHDQPIENPEFDEYDLLSRHLESGIELGMTREAYDIDPALFDTSTWKRRQMLKDRVHLVHINGNDYIMKERKTARHTDTKAGGHQDGLNSEVEFEVARAFASTGTASRDVFDLRFETPLAYVKYPDGYEFSLFKYEENMPDESPRHTIKEHILTHSEKYEGEFVDISQKARELYNSQPELLRGLDAPKEQEDTETHTTLTFEEFADLKARYLVRAARRFLDETVQNEGFVNTDINDHSIRINPDKPDRIEIIGFDFEYFKYDPDHATRAMWQTYLEDQNGESARKSLHKSRKMREIALAASYVLLDEIGPHISDEWQNYFKLSVS